MIAVGLVQSQVVPVNVWGRLVVSEGHLVEYNYGLITSVIGL